MGKFNALPLTVRMAIILALGAAIVAGAYYGPTPGLAAMTVANNEAAAKLNDKQADNAKLRPYQSQLTQINHQIEALERQMARQREIVPEQQSADQFIRDMQATAQATGIEIRSFVAKPINPKQYYSEVPFELEVDGPYFAVLNFFEKVGTMERIVNVDNLKMGGIGGKGASAVHRKYDYAPTESVAVSFVAKTFFSSKNAPAAAPATPAAKAKS
jgi:type IV pilus assembly protein PilO